MSLPTIPAAYGWPWDGILARLLLRENGYVNHPKDHGGPTRHGITLATLEEWRGAECTAEDVKKLTPQEASAIYMEKWVRHPRLRLEELIESSPPIIAELTLDNAIMFSAGRKRAALWVQMAINKRRPGAVIEDGWLGGETRAALAEADPQAVVNAIVGFRLRRHALVVEADPSQAVFLEGWINRCCHWLEAPS